jgi:hypothetical protein
MEWSPNNFNMMATACDQGEVRLFDIRTYTTPLQSLSMGGVCSSISWCASHPNLLAACNRDGFSVWDTRMVASFSTGSQPSRVLWADRQTQQSGNVAYQVTWANSETPCLISASSSSRLTWWDGQTGAKLGDGGEKSDPKDSEDPVKSGNSSLPISCSLLAMSSGRGILTANRIAVEQKREAVEGPSTIPRSMSSGSLMTGHWMLDKISHTEGSKLNGEEDEIMPKIKPLVDVMEEMDAVGLTSTPIWINSFPRSEYLLLL